MRLNIDHDLVKQLVSGQLPNKSCHLDELTHEPAIWSCDTGQWLSCFDSCQLTILWMSNIQDVDLPRHAWDTPPSLLIVFPTPPLQSVDVYVRALGQSRDNQTKRGWPYFMSMGLCRGQTIEMRWGWMGQQYKCGGCSGGWENDTNVVVVVASGKTIQMWCC